jgi:hypothetical protein
MDGAKKEKKRKRKLGHQDGAITGKKIFNWLG